MCSILGWAGDVNRYDKLRLIEKGVQRGRDGFGAWTNKGVVRSLDPNGFDLEKLLSDDVNLCVANFRAAPTTESESKLEYLQPYAGIVHNGTVANCAEYGEFAIDSMCLPYVFEDRRPDKVVENCAKIQGGFALAYAIGGGILVACNYKPVYYYSDDRRFIFGSTPEMVGVQRAVKMPPYSAIHWECGVLRIVDLPKRTLGKKVLLAASAGLDSTTVAWMLKSDGYQVTLVHFLYGCNAEEKELDRIRNIARLGEFELITMQLPKVFAGSIVEGKYNTDEKFGVRYAADWVSARNLLMMATLTSYAESHGFNYLAYGGNLEESGSYPDNELEFGRLFNQLLHYSVQNGYSLQLLQPVADLMKHEIVKVGHEIGVPYEWTWSCYGGGHLHCGQCSPCYMRRIAFERNGLKDPCQ